MAETLQNIVAETDTHLQSICSFTRAKPMRAVVDMTSFEDLKPGMMGCFAVLDWYKRLSSNLVSVIGKLKKGGSEPEMDTVPLSCALF